MKKAFGKNKGFMIFSMLTLLFIAAALGLYAACSIGGYYDDFGVILPALLVIAAACLVFCMRKAGKGSLTEWMRLLQLLVVGATVLALTMLLKERVFSIAILLGSDLEASNTAAYGRLYLSLASMGAMLLADLMTVISCFVKTETECA